jgi:hypothetical protein
LREVKKQIQEFGALGGPFCDKSKHPKRLRLEQKSCAPARALKSGSWQSTRPTNQRDFRVPRSVAQAAKDEPSSLAESIHLTRFAALLGA